MKDSVVEKIQCEIDEFFTYNESSEITGGVLWETFKAYLRGIIISIDSGEKREGRLKKENLVAKIYQLEQIHKALLGKDEATFKELTLKREELRELLEEEMAKAGTTHLKRFHIQGNKVGKHLASVTREKKDENYIEKIKDSKGKMRHTTKDIAEEFRQFFAGLYSGSKVGKIKENKEEKTKEYLKGVGLPTLSEADTLELERQITEEEIYQALKSSPTGKSPGPDGFTNNFYRKFSRSLVPRLRQIWNGLGKQGVLCGMPCWQL